VLVLRSLGVERYILVKLVRLYTAYTYSGTLTSTIETHTHGFGSSSAIVYEHWPDKPE